MTGESLNKATELRRSIEPQIGVKHPDYGYFAPPAPVGVRPATGGYFDVGRKRIRMMLGVPRHKSLEPLAQYRAILDKLVGFNEFFDDYDRQFVLPTVTAMGLKKATQSDLDEGAPLRVSRSHKLRPDLMSAIINDWRIQVQRVDVSKLELAVPANTNLGWPAPFAARDKVRPFVLAALALMVDVDRQKFGRGLREVYDNLRPGFGNPLILLGSRNQHTDKLIPFIDSGGLSWTQRFEPRTRAIFMGSKIGILYNRLHTKRLLKGVMAMPQHNQERPFIAKTISEWSSKPGFQTIAVDVSKFDKGHGNQYLVEFARAMSLVLQDPRVADDFVAEVSMPLLVRYGRDLFLTTDKIAPQLPSGVSFTTVAGLFFGDYICSLIGAFAGQSRSRLGHSWQYLNWGDDMVLFLPASVNREELLAKVQQELQLSLAPEPVIRYLGFNYGDDLVKTNKGYSIARLVMKQYFPERPKVYPFSAIGYIARLQFIPNADKFHHMFTASSWDERLLGPRFTWEGRHQALQAAMTKAAESPEFDSDALNFLLHGLEPIEGQQLLEPLGIDFDFSTWIGHHYMDTRDPATLIFKTDANLAKQFKESVAEIERHGSPAFRQFATRIASSFQLRDDHGMVF